MPADLIVYLMAVLAAVKRFRKIFSGLSREAIQVQGNIYKLGDQRRREQELRTIKELCMKVQNLTRRKGDIATAIEAYAIDPHPGVWDLVLCGIRDLSDDLEEIEDQMVRGMFSESSLAAELLIEVNKSKGLFLRYAEQSEPTTEAEIGTLREIGIVIRGITKHGAASLKKVDAYARKIAKQRFSPTKSS
jgi:hypothetical protein